MVWIVVYQSLWKFCVRNKIDQAGHHIELDRNPHLSSLYRERTVDAMKKLAAKRQFDVNTSFTQELQRLTEDEKIAYLFHIFDVNNSGQLQVTELKAMLMNWGCPASDARAAMKARNLSPDNQVDLQVFKAKFWVIWEFGLKCMAEIAAMMDEATQLPDGSLQSFQNIDQNTIIQLANYEAMKHLDAPMHIEISPVNLPNGIIRSEDTTNRGTMREATM